MKTKAPQKRDIRVRVECKRKLLKIELEQKYASTSKDKEESVLDIEVFV